MTNSFGTQLENAAHMLLDSIIGLFFDSRISLLNAFCVLIPFWSLVLIVDVLGRTRFRTRSVLRRLNQLFVCGLTVNIVHNTYYFCTKSVQTFHGKMHMVAALCCLLFIIYLAFDYKATEDVQYGILISYLGISLSLFTLPVEYFPPVHKAMSSLFLLGLVIYFLGLFLVAIAMKAKRLIR